MGKASATTTTSPAIVFAWWTAGLVTFAGGIAAAVYANLLAEAGEPWRSWRDALRTEGLVILTMGVTWLLLGALLHTPIAILRGARVRPGWLAVPVLLAYFAVLALIAVPLGDFAPAAHVGDSRRNNPGTWYGGFLGGVVLLPALAAVLGGLFHRTVPPEKPEPAAVARKRRDEPDLLPGLPAPKPPTSPLKRRLTDRWNSPDENVDPLRTVLSITVAVSWIVGYLSLAWMLVYEADRFDLPLVPADGRPIVAVGVALAVASLIVVAGQRTLLAGLLFFHVRPLLIALGAPAVLLTSVLMALLTHVVPGGTLVAVAVFGLPPAYVAALRRIQRHLDPSYAEDA